MATKLTLSTAEEAAEWAYILNQTEILKDEVQSKQMHPAGAFSSETRCLTMVPVTVAAVYARIKEIMQGHFITPEHTTELLRRNTVLLRAAQLTEQEIACSQAHPAKTVETVEESKTPTQDAAVTTPIATETTATSASAIQEEKPQQNLQIVPRQKTELDFSRFTSLYRGSVLHPDNVSVFHPNYGVAEKLIKFAELLCDAYNNNTEFLTSKEQEDAEGAVSAPEEQSNGATDELEVPRVAQCIARHAALLGVIFGSLGVERKIIVSPSRFDYTYPPKESEMETYLQTSLLAVSTVGMTVCTVVWIAATLFDSYTKKPSK